MTASNALFILRTFYANGLRKMPFPLTGQAILRKARQMAARFCADMAHALSGEGGATRIGDLHITAHAIERFIERVRPVSTEEARAALSSPAILLAANIGAHYVPLGSKHRVVIHDHTIITVLPADAKAWRLRFHDREFS